MRTESWKHALRFFAVVSAVLVATPGWSAIQGVVIDDHGAPLAGIRVRATLVGEQPATELSVTDMKGAYAIQAAPGTWVVAAETLRTTWLQANESPVVVVAADGTPSLLEANLTLVQVPALGYALPGQTGAAGALTPASATAAAVLGKDGDDNGPDAWHIAGLVLSGAAAGLSGWALSSADDASDQSEKIREELGNHLGDHQDQLNRLDNLQDHLNLIECLLRAHSRQGQVFASTCR